MSKAQNESKVKTQFGNPAAHAPGMPIVAVIGDGQLARMMQTEAIELGQSVRLLAGSPGASAAQVAADVVEGDYRDFDDLIRAVDGVDAVTFDHEHVPNEFLDTLLSQGVCVEPRPSALIYAQDKLQQRTKLRELGFPIPPFAAIDNAEDMRAFWEAVDGAVCIKACRGGYDGNGVWFPSDVEEACRIIESAEGTALMAEKKIAFERELSAMVARRRSGEVKAWPVVESVQSDGICHSAISPAPGLSEEFAQELQQLAVRVATELDVTGVLAVELFQTRDIAGEPMVYVNELAMRPHNTGHWTQDGCVTSQFEQHLRAVLDLPLGDTAPSAPVTVMVNTLGAETEPEEPLYQRMRAVWERFPDAKIHMYGKTHRPGRKLGHVNISGNEVEAVRENAGAAAYRIVHGVWPEK